MPRPTRTITAILAAFALETLSVTWLLKIPGGTLFFTILYFIAGCSIALLLLFSRPLQLPAPGKGAWKLRSNHFRVIMIGLMAMVMVSWCRYWFEEIPLDIENADMLPIIKVMGERFVAGQHKQVYDSIPWIWKGTQPIYLPAMWLPFVPAVALGIDIRWVTMAGLLFVFGVFIFIFRADHHRYSTFFTGVLAFLLFWWLLADNTPGIISVSEEGVVIAYYVLLVLALVSGNPWLIGFATSLCMLSRYALVGWIPAYVLCLALQKKWREASIFTFTGILCFIGLFLLPVGWQTFLRLARLPGNYIAFAARVWKDSPAVFSTGIGFAGVFGPQRVRLLHSLLVLLSFTVPFLFMLLCRWLRREASRRPGRFKEIANSPLAALKISLVVFYCFIDVPYLYLFYTSSFVSLIAIALLMRQENALEEGEGFKSGPHAGSAR